MEKGDIIMPLDFVTNPLFDLEGTDLDFKIEYSPTKMQGKNMSTTLLLEMSSAS